MWKRILSETKYLSKKWILARSKCKTAKRLEYRKRISGDHGFGDGFLDTTPEAWYMRVKADKLDFI